MISVATIISYLTGPVSAMALRRTAPDLQRPLRIKGLPMLAGLAFILATELLYWAKWPLTGEIILLMVVALPVYLYYQAKCGLARFRSPDEGRLVAGGLSAGHRCALMGRQ